MVGNSVRVSFKMLPIINPSGIQFDSVKALGLFSLERICWKRKSDESASRCSWLQIGRKKEKRINERSVCSGRQHS